MGLKVVSRVVAQAGAGVVLELQAWAAHLHVPFANQRYHIGHWSPTRASSVLFWEQVGSAQAHDVIWTAK